MNLPDLTAFATVAQLRSFRAAARTLGVSPSALSHSLRQLEARLGVRLLNRTTRSVSTTEAGARLLSRLQPALADITEALSEASARSERPSGLLRLNISHTSARLVMAPILARYAEAFPDVKLELVANDSLVDIVEAGFDAGLRLGESLQDGMVAVRAGPPLRFAVVGSPDYLARAGIPLTPEDLAGHRRLAALWPGGGLFDWEFEKDGRVLTLAPDGPVRSNDAAMLLRAALDGAGLYFTFEGAVQQEIAAGRLVRVLGDWCAPFAGFHLYYPGRRHVSPALRGLIDLLRRNA